MKRVNKNFQDLNKNIIIIGVILILSTIVGTYLNKIWPQYQEIGITNINKLKESYASDIPLINIIASNIKSDIMLMIGVLMSSLLVVTAPIAMCIFMIKGISIGYIINSTIIAL